jgi:hypothetical protein
MKHKIIKFTYDGKNENLILYSIKLIYGGKKYKIECKQNKYALHFKDENGGCIGFVRRPNTDALSVFVNDKYEKYMRMWEKYPRMKGYHAYTLAPKQVKILKEWLTK